jgi:hypothetical protein
LPSLDNDKSTSLLGLSSPLFLGWVQLSVIVSVSRVMRIGGISRSVMGTFVSVSASPPPPPPFCLPSLRWAISERVAVCERKRTEGMGRLG